MPEGGNAFFKNIQRWDHQDCTPTVIHQISSFKSKIKAKVLIIIPLSGSSYRGPEKIQVQVPRTSEDLREQELGLHQVEPRAVRRDEGGRTSEARRRQRQVCFYI